MSETKHPERRAVEVGQRRRNHKEIFTIYAIEGSHAIVCRAGQTDPVTDYIHKGDESCCWESISVLADCEIVADAPAVAHLAVDRTGCKAWCGAEPLSVAGQLYDSAPESVVNGSAFAREDFCDMDAHDPRNVRWCSRRCKNTKMPPLAAQPAETLALDAPCPGQCGGGAAADNGPCIRCKPAPQPAPAKAHDFSDPYCVRNVFGGNEPACVGCGRTAQAPGPCIPVDGWRLCYEAYINTDGLTNVLDNPKVPERLERPKLAHSSMWADEAEDVS